MLDNLITETQEQPEDRRVQIKSYPCIIPDSRWPALVVDSETIRVWCELDEDFAVELLSPISGLAHSVSASMDFDGVEGFFDKYSNHYHLEWRASRALQSGLAYRQPFYVELYAHHYVSHTPDGTEYDCDMQVEIVHIPKIPVQETAARWDEWLKRSNL